MTVELYYFEGCPSYLGARENIEEALREEGCNEEIRMVRVESPEHAVAKRLIGSPTVRLDGVDVEGPEAEKRGYGMGCRVYRNGGGTTGWPSVEQVRRAIRARLVEGDRRIR